MDYSIHSYNCSMVDNPNYIPAKKDANGVVTESAVGVEKIQRCSHFKLANIVNAILAFLFLRVFLWIILQSLIGYYKRKNMDSGSQYAINQLIKYVAYVIMLLTVIQAMGFQLTVIWGGAAALLVGFGLGLQQTFNDLFSGIIIMIEGSVHVGDMVKVKDEIGKVTKIGIRASEVLMRDDVELIVPNSHLVMDSIANWNHNDHKARFYVSVGVAYGSDTELVKKTLLSVAAKHSKIIDYPEPFVRFANFGDSSLNFELHFWTFDVFRVLNTQSDLRFDIDKAFRENNIAIPFPQRDLWIRNAGDLK
ncbi:MAG: mechanosensitive ion channel [Saprospiraceae bacterium]|nr:mechanosensitive ion channel [Saprospiraceae bacterium]